MSDAATLPLVPISEAPVRRNRQFGPCLLTPGPEQSRWTIGYWDGGGWVTVNFDERLEPRFFLLLGTPPD